MNRTRRLVLDNLHNARDLGGFPTAGGGVTSFGCFIRSEAPCGLSRSDLDALRAYGITTLIDFRGDGERKNRPSDLAGQPWITLYEKPLFNDAAAQGAPPPDKKPTGWGEQYIIMAESSRRWAVDVLTIAANCPGGLMYHCTTGKDRTGLMTALLLSIAGVPERDIVADYCSSMIFLEPVYDKIRRGIITLGPGRSGENEAERKRFESYMLDPEFFRTPPEAMEMLLRHFDEAYGGVFGYLEEIGAPKDTAPKIRAKFLRSDK